MAVLTIRNLDDHTKNALRVRAAQHGVSMEEEARRILRLTLETSSQPDRFEAVRGKADVHWRTQDLMALLRGDP